MASWTSRPICSPAGSVTAFPSWRHRVETGQSRRCGCDTPPATRPPLTQYDDGKGFIFNFNGASGRLVNVASNEFRSEIDTEFLRFNYLTNSGGNSWLVTDKSGNRFNFGETSNSRMANGKVNWPSNQSGGTFRWALNRAQTINGSTNLVTYTNISGALYPVQSIYNGHTNSIAANNSVQFFLQNRSDVRSAYNSGYQVRSSQLLSKIYCKVGTNVVRRYDLTYTNSPSTLRSLLTSVQVYGLYETNSLPAITFAYQQQTRQFQSVNWTNLATTWPNTSPFWTTPTGDNGAGVVSDLVDMDGDGLPDRLLRQPDSLLTHTNFFFQRNNGNGFASLETNRWGPLTVQTSPNGSVAASEWDYVNGTRDRTLDLNGDGYPDHVMDPIEAFFLGQYTRYTNFVVDLNNGTNFSTSNIWQNVTALYPNNTGLERAIENQGYVRLIDMNGDGLPDRVLHRTTLNPRTRIGGFSSIPAAASPRQTSGEPSLIRGWTPTATGV